jgi:hypothetical protein
LVVLGAVSMVAAIVGGGVSLPGGVSFGVVTSRAVRGILAGFSVLLLVVGGLVLALSTVSLEPGLDTPVPPPTPPSTSPVPPDPGPDPDPGPRPEPSVDDYIVVADSLCADAAERHFGVGYPAGDTGRDMARWLRQHVVIMRGMADRLHGLTAPAADQEAAAAVWVALDEVVNRVATTAAVAETGDEVAYQAASQDAQAAKDDYRTLVQQFGMLDCQMNGGGVW